MANLNPNLIDIESSIYWTSTDLADYNIVIKYEDALTFFGTDELPLSTVDPEILTRQTAKDMTLGCNARFIDRITLAMVPVRAEARDWEESAVIEFAAELLELLGYVERRCITRSLKELPLLSRDEWKSAKCDVCRFHCLRKEVLLVVNEDRHYMDDPRHAEAQLVAQAIAAFDYNNRSRTWAGLPTLDSKIMPGIVILGTAPTFYKIPVTAALVQHHPGPRPDRRLSEGMEPRDNREIILRSYEAFKSFVDL
ncbi:hypothetical protein PENSPDRAFT_748141 [Peniophora sp. CONT]|nr:hypothetical protein PENSPDRAFT_748141 [Peniophora sp. CONT]